MAIVYGHLATSLIQFNFYLTIMFQYISYYLPLSLIFLAFSVPILVIAMLIINFILSKVFKSIIFFNLKKIMLIVIAFSALVILSNLYLFEIPTAVYKCSNNSELKVYRYPAVKDSLLVRYNSTGSTMQVSSDNTWSNNNYQFLLSSDVNNQSKLENQCLYKKAKIQIFDSPESQICTIQKSGETNCSEEFLIKYGMI